MQPIAITEHPRLGPSVSGRELYNLIALPFCKSDRDMFSDWFNQRKEKLGLVEGTDFMTQPNSYPNPSGYGRRVIEQLISVATAKQFATMQLGKAGQPVLKYLEQVEQNPALAQGPAVQPRPVDEPNTLFSNPAPAAPVQPPTEKAAPQSEESSEVDARLARLERNVAALVSLFQPAAIGLTPAPTTEPEAEPAPRVETTRTKLVRLVDLYEMAQLTNKKPITHQRIWNMLYAHLSFKFGFDAYALGEGKRNPNYLDIAEEAGQVENLYAIAQELLTVS